MKTNLFKGLRTFLFLPLFILVLFTSCQNEETDITETNTEETFDASSALAQYILNTTTYDGSFDNIIDSANCISVNLPVTVIVNGVTITIESVEDYDFIEDIFDEFDDDIDELEIQFPITIILSDYEQVVINNYDELFAFVEDCLGENEDDDDIECIDFQYPISISVFDADFNVIETVEVNDDEELYEFIDELEGGVLASINFPVTMVLADGSTIEVNNNDELLAAIEEAEDDCDEDDDNDWNDDDCDEESIELALKECLWEITEYNGDDVFDDYYINFLESYEFTVSFNGNVLHDGVWSLEEVEGEFVLNLDTDWGDLAGEWTILECNDDDEYYLSNGEITVEIEQDCDNNTSDCTEEQVDAYLMECHWVAVSYNGDDQLAGFDIYFNESMELVLHSNGAMFEGVWSTSGNPADGVVVEISQFSGGTQEDFNNQWQVVECTEEQMVLVGTTNSVELVLERDCEETNYFECYSNFEMVVCDDETVDGFTTFDLNMVYPNCVEDNIEERFYMSMADAETQTNELSSPFTNTTNPQTIYARVQLAGTDIFEIFEVELIVENCNTTCTVAQVNEYLMECKWEVANLNGSDDLLDYELFFEDGNTLSVLDIFNGNTYSGYWNVSETDTGGILLELANIAAPNVQAISGYWDLVECESDRLQFTNDNSEVLVIEQKECYTEEQLFSAITECSWEINSFISDGDDLTADYNDVLLTFYENEFVIGEVGDSEINYGGLEPGLTANEQLIVLFSMFSGTTASLGNYYTVDSITEEEIVFTSQGIIELVLHRTCSNSNQDGDTEQIKDWLYVGDWEITYATMESVDETVDYDGIMFDFQSGTNLIANNNDVTTNLQYEVLRDNAGSLRLVINYLGQFPYWQMDDDWYITEVDENRIELHHINDDANDEFVLVFEKL